MDMTIWGYTISIESWMNIEKIYQHFTIYNLKIKSNTVYPIHLIDVSLSFIESMAMTRYLIYKHKTNNMKDKRLPKIVSNSSQSHMCLKRGCHKYTKS
jgi:hypothetical protein